LGTGVSGLGMTPREVYLMKSADLFAKAEVERDPALKADLGNMARAYLRLADQAKRNDETKIIHEMPSQRGRRDEP
jgi:hypothetical protein